MNILEIRNSLDSFTSSPLSLNLQDLVYSTDSNITLEVIRKTLIKDNRFIVIEGELPDDVLFISSSTLFRLFSKLSMDLARAKQARLTSAQLGSIMSALRTDGQWIKPPIKLVKFGQKFGFITPAWSSNQYVFPLARMLSFLTNRNLIIIRNLLKEMEKAENRELLLKQQPEELIQKVLSILPERTAYIVSSREGLISGRRTTLEQIGSKLNITRERVRQLEGKFWERAKHSQLRYLLLKAFLCDFIIRRGRLTYSVDDPDAPFRRFLIKYVGIPEAMYPYNNSVLLGVKSRELVKRRSIEWPFQRSLTISNVEERFGFSRRFFFSKAEAETFCENIKLYLYKRLNKSQRVVFTMKSIGKPAHFSEITEEYNRLFPDSVSTERNIHAVLSRESYGVVWIGMKGVFALEAWGYRHPEKGLYDTVTEIVEDIYSRTKRPVSLAVITAELGKYRKAISSTSLSFCVLGNLKLRCVSKNYFVPRDCTDQEEGDISADLLDNKLRKFRRACEQKS